MVLTQEPCQIQWAVCSPLAYTVDGEKSESLIIQSKVGRHMYSFPKSSVIVILTAIHFKIPHFLKMLLPNWLCGYQVVNDCQITMHGYLKRKHELKKKEALLAISI